MHNNDEDRETNDRLANHEFKILNRLKGFNFNCPNALEVRENILVTSLIGSYNRPAITLREQTLYNDEEENFDLYKTIVDMMKNMFHVAKIVHGKLNEDNILCLGYECSMINFSEAVETSDHNAKEKLLEDCRSIASFFKNEFSDSKKLFNKIISEKVS